MMSEFIKDVVLSLGGATSEPQMAGPEKQPDCNNAEEINETEDEKEVIKKEKGDVIGSALLEMSTFLPHEDKREDEGTSVPEESDTEMNGEGQDLSVEQSEHESIKKSKAKWRESMPEGDRWRDDEIEVQQDYKRGNFLANDKEDEEGDSNWMSEKAALVFTPQVTIVHPSSIELPVASRHFVEKDMENEPEVEPDTAVQFYPEWSEQDHSYYLCEHLCSEKLKLALAIVAAGLLFPLLVWGGYVLLPFDPPLLDSAPLRVVYTLRCAFFATIPIMLGVLVQGVARLRHSSLSPLYQNNLVNTEVAVHWHFINESLGLFLFYFVQLAVMASYISQDMVKLVPLLTIIFVFGRLIYWLCLSLGSSVRGLGFGLSFFPILVMLGTNLYYVCSSVEQGAVFEVAPPTTAPPPKQRWWG